MRYIVRTTGERVLDESFSQIDYELLVDYDHYFGKILGQQLLSVSDDDIILMEDDIILCKDFLLRVQCAINNTPSEIINFFSLPEKYIEPKLTNLFIYNQCTYFPKNKLRAIALYLIENENQLFTKPYRLNYKSPTVEYLLRCATTDLNYQVFNYRPCLVQHIDTGSLIGHNLRRTKRRTPYFIDYLNDLCLTYDNCKTCEAKAKLKEYMDRLFDKIDKELKIFDYYEDKILIVGYGTVGKNLQKELSKKNPDIYDKYKTENNTKKNIKYNFCFICVDTPLNSNNTCNIEEVENAVKENDAEIYIIKSTIPPGTVEQLKEKYNKHIIHSPEYYGDTLHCSNFEFNFTILGGDKDDCIKVLLLLQDIYDARHTFRIVDSKTAELVKYMENSYLAMKVTFCNLFFDIAKSLGVDYETLRELFILDPRVNPSHTFVYRDKRGYDSHCLNKDIPAIINSSKCNTSLLKSIVDCNRMYNERN